MAILNYQKASAAGTAYATTAAAAGGDQVLPSLDGAIIVNNGGGASITVTITVPGNTRYGLPDPDFTITVPNGQARLIGPFGSDLANGAGYVDIGYSGVTSVTVAAISI